MILKFIKLLQQVEKHSDIHTKENSNSKLPYKRFGKVWIRADKPLKDIYTETLKYSELLFYPNTNYKMWTVWILRIFKLKKDSLKFRDLLGLGLNWHFLKKEYFPLHADIIYYRMHAIVMIYASLEEQRVAKTAVTNWGLVQMKSEIESQRIASSITLKDVFIPSILKEYHDADMDYVIEEYFAGKGQSFKEKKDTRS